MQMMYSGHTIHKKLLEMSLLILKHFDVETPKGFIRFNRLVDVSRQFVRIHFQKPIEHKFKSPFQQCVSI